MNLKYIIAAFLVFLTGTSFAQQSTNATFNPQVLPPPAINQSNQSYHSVPVLPPPSSNFTYTNSTNASPSAANVTRYPGILPRPQPSPIPSYNSTQTALLQEWLTGGPLILRLLGV